mmetsp:Transcript_28123/g.45081  ORF Transcript_28123/g.45081 Transcript_28123/m.45081 type:complete len:281 (-) Transcript_28123:752-1594(-)
MVTGAAQPAMVRVRMLPSATPVGGSALKYLPAANSAFHSYVFSRIKIVIVMDNSIAPISVIGVPRCVPRMLRKNPSRSSSSSLLATENRDRLPSGMRHAAVLPTTLSRNREARVTTQLWKTLSAKAHESFVAVALVCALVDGHRTNAAVAKMRRSSSSQSLLSLPLLRNSCEGRLLNLSATRRSIDAVRAFARSSVKMAARIRSRVVHSAVTRRGAEARTMRMMSSAVAPRGQRRATRMSVAVAAVTASSSKVETVSDSSFASGRFWDHASGLGSVDSKA